MKHYTKTGNFTGIQLRRALITSLTVLSTCVAANAATVDWAAGQWSHPGQPVADARYLDGATSGTSVLGEGITVNVAHTPTGGATGASGNLTVSNVVRGGVAPDSLRLQQQNDLSTTADTMDRYSTTSLTFNTLVSTTGFTIFDVDLHSGGSWSDFIIVRAFSGLVEQSVTYTPGGANETATFYGLSGVRGATDANNNSSNGNVGVQVAGGFDRLDIIFTQQFAPGGDGSHGVGVSNIAVTPVPEASSLAFAALGLCAGFRRSRRKSA